MSDIEFTTGPIPQDDTPEFNEGVALPPGARACKNCGTILPEHNGRGRKPTLCDDCKRAGKTAASSGTVSTQRAASGDVARALATMDALYKGMVLAANLFRPALAPKIAAQIPEAQKLNRQAFEMDKKLAASVAKFGTPGGIGAFIIAQGMIATPIAMDVIAIQRAKPKAKKMPEVVDASPDVGNMFNG